MRALRAAFVCYNLMVTNEKRGSLPQSAAYSSLARSLRVEGRFAGRVVIKGAGVDL